MFCHHFRIYLAKTWLFIFTFYTFFSQCCTSLSCLSSGQDCSQPYTSPSFWQRIECEISYPRPPGGLPCSPWLRSHVLPPSHAVCALVQACQAVQWVVLLQDKPGIFGRLSFQLGWFPEERHCEVLWTVLSIPGEKTVWTSVGLRCYRRVP